jgi:hypothetical protein
MTLSVTIQVQPRPVIEPAIEPEKVQLYQHREDMAVYGYIRSCAPCPSIFPMTGDIKTEIDEQWQYYVRAINWGMELQYVAALFGPEKAFTNRNVENICSDWLRRRNLDMPPPWWDKVRTTSRSVMTGVEIGDTLKVAIMDGNKPPALKPGKSYPKSVGEINPDSYMFMPQTHRHLFCVANIVNIKGEVVPFDNGALYDWTGDGMPYTFIPHIARFAVFYPLKNLIKLPPGSPVPSPYRRL